MRQGHRLFRLFSTSAVALAVAGCGGGGDDSGPLSGKPTGKTQRSTAGDNTGARDTVRDYLRALVDGDGSKACSKLTPAYQKSVYDMNKAFAQKAGAKDCAGVVDAATKRSSRTTFEGEPLNKKTVEKIPLKVTVRESGEEQNATVTGAQGLQRYELYTTKGKWAISDIVQAGG
jgi:hypothetical protein